MRDPMRYSLGTAAIAAGKSKTTIQRAIVKGRISAEKMAGGGYSIDPAELHRVFPMANTDTVSRDPKLDTTRPHDETPELRAKIDGLEAMLAREREALEEVRALGFATALHTGGMYPERLQRVLPDWYVDDGNISIYYAEHKLLPGKTRAFVDFIIEQFAEQQWGRR